MSRTPRTVIPRTPSIPLLAALLIPACSSVGAPSGEPVREARSADGLALAYEASGAGEPALVFVHGWCCDRAFWRHQLEVFSRERLVVALDLGGFGESGVERASWTLEALSADVAAVVDDVGCSEVVLVGHSMGGPVALLAVPRISARVRGVIGVDSLHDVEFRYPPDFLEETARAFRADFAGCMEASIRSMFPAGADPGLVEWVIARASSSEREPALALFESFPDFDLATTLSSARVPVRCINAASGSGSPETDFETNRRYADYDAVLMEGVGHFPMLERPREFETHLRAWLAELAP